jgi:hypothetical protein
METPRITILRPGKFTAVDGTEHSYSEADLTAIAAAYDPSSNPAPLVIGHPKLDHPAYGWVKGLSVEGGELVADADPDKLEPAFAEAVNAGRYRKVSASFYPPGHSQSPHPATSYLKHIGFLGAAAPGVKGLGTVAFAEAADLVTIETKPENDPMADFAEREGAITTKEAELAQREQLLTEREQAARHEGNVAFAEALVAGGKLAPAGQELAVIALDGLDAEATVSFGEADGKISPLAALKKLFDGAGTLVAFGEHARPPADKDKPDKDAQSIADKAVAFADSEKAAGRIVTVAAAVRKVMADSKAD